MRNRYEYEMLGYNFRLTDVHAAIGLAQLGRMDEATRRRRSNAAYLSAHLRRVVTPVVKEGREHVWHQYTVTLPEGVNRAAAVRQLSQEGIGTGVFYPRGAHRFPHVHAYTGDLDLPVTDRIAASVLSLPVHPLLTEPDLERIVAAVNSL
jgi:perosamine synthetase